jgi:hypothetical protein
MNIPHELIIAISDSQKNKMIEVNKLVSEELEYIKEATITELHKKISDIKKDPFNNFVTVPFKNYNPSDRIFTVALKKKYFQDLQHPLQVCKDGYVVLILSSYFHPQNDPRPTEILVKQSLCPASQEMKENLSAEDTSADLNIFSDKEKSEYEKKLSGPPPLITPRTSKHGVQPKETGNNIFLAKSFLERRNSKIYTPSLNSARDHSISET